MPLFNGTGPLGFGLGRGNGPCGRSVHFARREWAISRRKNNLLWGIAFPVLITAIRELANPTGVLRQFTRTLLHYKKNNKQCIIGNVKYSVLERCSQKIDKKIESPVKEIKQ